MWESRFLEPAPRASSGTSGRALAAAVAGVATVTVLNEGARRIWTGAPRLDVLGKRALRRAARRAGGARRVAGESYWLALGASLLADGAYFALAGIPARRAVTTGATLGALAGLGAVLLPEVMGLGARPTRRMPQTAVATVAWYVAAGIAAGAAGRAWERRRERRLARGR